MSILNFDWLVLHEIMTREIRNVKKEQNQKRDRSRQQTKQQQKSDDSSGSPVNSITLLLLFFYFIQKIELNLLTLSLHPFLLFIYWLNPGSPAILASHLLVDPGRHVMLTQLETPYAIVNPG